MELEELKYLWSQYDDRLEQTLKVNSDLFKQVSFGKVKSLLTNLLASKVFESLTLLFFLWLFTGFIADNISSMKFVLLAGTADFFVLAALISCIRQIYFILSIDYSEPVTTIQKKITLLKLNILWYIRFSFLCMPLFMLYIIIGFKMLFDADITRMSYSSWWTIPIIISLALIPLSIWVYRNVNYKNLNNFFVKLIFDMSGGKQVSESMKFLDEIKEFAKN